VNDKMNLIN